MPPVRGLPPRSRATRCPIPVAGLVAPVAPFVPVRVASCPLRRYVSCGRPRTLCP